MQPISLLLVSEQLQIYSELLSFVSTNFIYNQKCIYISMICFPFLAYFCDVYDNVSINTT